MDINEILVPPNSKVVSTSSSGTISDAIIEHHFPNISTEVELAHFTDFNACKKILSSGELQLNCILKWISENEFCSFIKSHGLDDYLAQSNGEFYYQTLMRDLFFASFSKREPKNLTHMWDTFAERGTGTKLVFKVKVVQKRSELRPMLYHSLSKDPVTLIKSLSDIIRFKSGREFIMRGISRIGFFYLPLGNRYELDDETRLLIKAGNTGLARKLIVMNGESAYLPLKIGKSRNNFCDLKLVEIQAGPKCDIGVLRQLITLTPWNNIPITSAAK